MATQEDNEIVETGPSVAVAALPQDKLTLRARMEQYPSS